jgi:hypothetical protein
MGHGRLDSIPASHSIPEINFSSHIPSISTQVLGSLCALALHFIDNVEQQQQEILYTVHSTRDKSRKTTVDQGLEILSLKIITEVLILGELPLTRTTLLHEAKNKKFVATRVQRFFYIFLESDRGSLVYKYTI